MKRYRAYLFDLDGTLYRGDEPVPYAVEALAQLRAEGACIGFLTNNSGETPAGIAQKLVRMGFQAAPPEVVTSGMAAAEFAKGKGWVRLFVIGEPGLVEVMRRAELEVVNADRLGNVEPVCGLDAHAVVCGICRTFTYALLDAGFQQLLGGAGFLATNPDATYPLEAGRLQPGAGSLVAALQTCSGVAPNIVGKPEPAMVRIALGRFDVPPSDALVVGDRPDTDLAAGKAAGCDTRLVMTGVTSRAPSDAKAILDLRALLR